MTEEINEWARHAMLVIDTLDRLDRGQKDLSERLNTLQIDLATLKVQAGLWGMIMGAVPVLITIGIQVLLQWHAASPAAHR